MIDVTRVLTFDHWNKCKVFPIYNTMYWHFLVKIDVGPIFCMIIVHCVHMNAERPILAKKNFIGDFSVWSFLRLEHTLLSELPHTRLLQHRNKIYSQDFFKRLLIFLCSEWCINWRLHVWPISLSKLYSTQVSYVS